jgi:UDP-N-acetylmuramyl pentapeptide synthase
VGDMLELGAEAAAEHETLGRHLAARRVGQVIVLGERAGDVARGLTAAGAPSPMIAATAEAAAATLAEATRAGDWILVKASRGMRLERVIEAMRTATGDR